MKRFIQIVKDVRGTEIAEAAAVLPLVFMILLGIYWFGRAYNIYSTISHAAREGATVAATPACATCAVGGGTWAGTSFPDNTAVATAVTNVLQASHVDTGALTTYTPTPAPVACVGVAPAGGCSVAPNNITVCRNVQLSAAASPEQQCGTVVSFRYPYQFYFPFTSLNFQLVNIPASAGVAMEY
jgi:TadE-like protein